MILSDIAIKEALQRAVIGIDPYPKDSQFQPVSVDLCLGKQFKRMSQRVGPVKIKWEDARNSDGSCILQPRECILAHTEETISIGNGVVGRVEGRSSWGRRFLSVHVTAGFIDSGFQGQITLEIINHSNRRIRLEPGIEICQIVFEEAHPSKRLYGNLKLGSKYQNQKGAQEDRL